MKWLISGGCGFIGVNLVAALRRNKVENIRIIDNLSSSTKRDLANVCAFQETPLGCVGSDGPLGVELIVGDIRDQNTSHEGSKGVDIVVHLAACTGVVPSLENPHLDCETNVLGTLNFLSAAKTNNCKSFIFASSGAPLGEQEPPIHEDKLPRPISPYGASKLSGEAYCHAFYGSYGLNTIALRFSNVYGPSSMYKQSVVAKFIKKTITGEKLTIYGDGFQTRDFIYVGDLVRAIILSARSGLGGEVFQIATNRETSIAELAQKISDIMGELGNKLSTIEHVQPLAGEVRRNYSDISKAKRLLKWQPEVDLDTGLRLTTAWFLEHRALALH